MMLWMYSLEGGGLHPMVFWVHSMKGGVVRPQIAIVGPQTRIIKML